MTSFVISELIVIFVLTTLYYFIKDIKSDQKKKSVILSKDKRVHE